MRFRKGQIMLKRSPASKAESAEIKLQTGTLMNVGEVAAKLDVCEATIHRLPLPSIRVGRSLRFDPKDVLRLIDSCREPIAI